MKRPPSYIGVKDLSWGARIEKRDLLLFDELAIPGLAVDLEVKAPHVRAELEWLQEKGLIFEANPEQARPIIDLNSADPVNVDVGLLLLHIVRIASVGSTSERVLQSMSRITDFGADRLINTWMRVIAAWLQETRGVRAVPVLRSFGIELGDQEREIQRIEEQLGSIRRNFETGLELIETSDAIVAREYYAQVAARLAALRERTAPTTAEMRGHADVIEVVLRNIAVPDETVAWEQILDFRQDPDSQESLVQLRRWMRTLAEEQRPAYQITEEIEYLLAQHSRHMRLHKMKTQPGALRTIITIAAQAAQHLSKGEWGDAAQQLFGIRDRKVLLLEAESNAPGKEVAYLLRTQENFGP